MATTYGYGGEFSSDEDVDKIEQQQRNQATNALSKPSKSQIEATIETIRLMPIEQPVNLTDDLLAALLDHYKTRRGPIVDSTRGLYTKIVLRLIRGESVQGNNEQLLQAARETNGSGAPKSINNNDIEIISKRAQPHIQAADSFSSDDEDQPSSGLVNRKTAADSRPTQAAGHNNAALPTADDQIGVEDAMDVDSETHLGPIRTVKQVDIATDEDDSATESSSGSSSDSDSVLDVTPIKPQQANQTTATTGLIHEQQPKSTLLATPKQPESSAKRQQPIAQSTPKDSLESVKKPYTRSQRVAASRAATSTSKAKNSTESSKSGEQKVVPGSSTATSQAARVSRKKYFLLTVTLLMVLLAFVAYFFRAKIISTAQPLLSRKISFS